MTLNTFIDDEIQLLQRFKDWYITKHIYDPANYPLEIGGDDTGIWDEMFNMFKYE